MRTRIFFFNYARFNAVSIGKKPAHARFLERAWIHGENARVAVSAFTPVLARRLPSGGASTSGASPKPSRAVSD